MFAGIADQAAIAEQVKQLEERLNGAVDGTQRLYGELLLDYAIAFGPQELHQIPLDAQTQRLSAWLESIDQLPGWTNYALRARHARDLGLTSLVDVLENGTTPTKDAVDSYDRLYFGQLLRSIVRQKPELAHFNGELHEKHVAEFKQLDGERL